jgi:D-3-phosphoglycerate dehydrogenase
VSADHILVATSNFAADDPEPRRELEACGIPFTINPLRRRLKAADLLVLAAESTGIVAGLEPYTPEVLAALPKLRVISRVGVGTDNVDHEAAKARGVIVRITPNVVVQPVAELTLAMIFDLLRHVSRQSRDMRSRRWNRALGRLAAGKTLGVIGLGRIGRRVAELAVAVGMKVVGTDITPDQDWARRTGVAVVDLDTLLTEAEVVSLNLAPASGQHFTFGTEHIARMRPSACLINVARGSLLDEAALAEALRSGRLGGAALDVYSKEPYDGPLCDLDNVVLTPHVGTFTRESQVQMELEAVHNVVESLRS